MDTLAIKSGHYQSFCIIFETLKRLTYIFVSGCIYTVLKLTSIMDGGFFSVSIARIMHFCGRARLDSYDVHIFLYIPGNYSATGLKSTFFTSLHFGYYLVNHSSNEDETAQEYRETILLSKYLLKLVKFYG